MPHTARQCGPLRTLTRIATKHEFRLTLTYEAAILELDPAKLLQRIALAQSAVLNQMEDGSSRPSDRQQLALHDALHMLSTLRSIAERDIGE